MSSSTIIRERAGKVSLLRGRRRVEQITLLAFLVPALLYVILLFAYPLAQGIIISFQNYDFQALAAGGGPFVGVANYVDVLQSPVTIRAIINTAVFTVGSIVFQFLIGLAMAVFFNQRFPASEFIRRLILVPWVMPLVAVGTMFQLVFQTSNGMVNQILQGIGIIHTGIPWLSNGVLAVVAIIIANIWAGVPFNAMLLYSGLQDVPPELLEAANVDGANRLQRFLWVTVPSMWQVILIVLMLGVVYTVKAFDLVIVLTNGGPANESQLMSSWAYTQAFTAFQFGNGTAAGNILLVFCLIVGLIYLRISRGASVAGGGQ